MPKVKLFIWNLEMWEKVITNWQKWRGKSLAMTTVDFFKWEASSVGLKQTPERTRKCYNDIEHNDCTINTETQRLICFNENSFHLHFLTRDVRKRRAYNFEIFSKSEALLLSQSWIISITSRYLQLGAFSVSCP